MGITDTAQLQNYMILGEALLDFRQSKLFLGDSH